MSSAFQESERGKGRVIRKKLQVQDNSEWKLKDVLMREENIIKMICYASKLTRY